jgi:hypothetical protein
MTVLVNDLEWRLDRDFVGITHFEMHGVPHAELNERLRGQCRKQAVGDHDVRVATFGDAESLPVAGPNDRRIAIAHDRDPITRRAAGPLIGTVERARRQMRTPMRTAPVHKHAVSPTRVGP